MTLCPIALAVGCAKCPAFKVCPLKSVIGDHRAAQPPPEKKAASDKKKSTSDKPLRPTRKGPSENSKGARRRRQRAK